MPESRVLELRDKLLANEGYQEILEWLAVDCGVTVSISALTPFYLRHCAPLIREQRAMNAVKAETIVDEAGRTDWNAATLELVKQVSFEMLSGQRTDPKVAEKFVKLVLKADAQAMDRDKLEILKANAAKADAATEVTNDGKLSDEEKAARLKQIFGMG